MVKEEKNHLNSRELRILAIGAHPDDCDIKAGGTAIRYRQLGHRVKFLSLTNGDTGHHAIGGIELARRRHREAHAAAAIAGAEYQEWDIHCGELMPTLENRRALIRIIREFAPDLIMTHRPNDYHPDHRYTSQLVQDACYLVTVPNNLSLTDHLQQNPVAVYFSDAFKKPLSFSPDVVVPIDDVFDQKLEMLHCHESQVYEWLPFNQGKLDQVPKGQAERKTWLAEQPYIQSAHSADTWRAKLVEQRGPAAAKVRYAEAFEACECGAPLTPEVLTALFPF